MSRKLVIIGGVAAGSRGAARAKRVAPDTDVTLLTREPHISYSACSFPYYIGRHVDRVESLILHSPEEFESSRGVKVLARHEATHINRAKREVSVKNLATGNESRLPYDALLIATGASPRPLAIKGAELGRVFTLRSPGDARAIRETIERSDVRRATVIGGGLIGVEVAENLMTHALDDVALIHSHPAIQNDMLDTDMALLIERELRALGVRLYLGDKARRIESRDGRHAGVVITERDRLDTDAIIAAIGVEPNILLAKEAGLTIGAAGAIAVNERMQTSDPAIFAAGDCVESFQLISRRMVRAPFGSVANRQGRVAGTNLAGGGEQFPGIVGAALTHVGRLTAGRTGLTEREARDAGFDFASLIIHASPRAGWAADGDEKLWLKAVVDKPSRRLLGLQVIGAEGADKRLDVATQLLHAGAGIDALVQVEAAYHPLLSQAVDPLNTLGQALEKILDSGVDPVSAEALAARLKNEPENLVLLDMRAPREKARMGSLPGARHIPLNELARRAAGELPREKSIITLDTSGRQALNAALLLRGLGFSGAAPLNGGVTFWRGDLV